MSSMPSALAYGGVSFEVLGGEGKRWTPEPTRSYPPVATARTEASLLIPKRVIGNDQVIGLARTTCGARAGKGPSSSELLSPMRPLETRPKDRGRLWNDGSRL
jgi:hypothetical protein